MYTSNNTLKSRLLLYSNISRPFRSHWEGGREMEGEGKRGGERERGRERKGGRGRERKRKGK